MKILANYGYKDSVNSYSCTFETLGDVPVEKVVETVNDLFRLAKQAVIKQVDLNKSAVESKEKPFEELVVPAGPKEITVNGNGKMKIKDPEGPASPKQLAFIKKLAKEKNMEIETKDLTKQDASHLIDTLMNG